MRNAWVRSLRAAESDRQVPASSADLVAVATTSIGEPAVGWAVESAAHIVRTVAPVVGGGLGSSAMTGYEREACEACLLTSLIALVGDPATQPPTPVEAINQVRMAVRQGVAVATVVGAVWSSHALVHDALLDELHRLVPADEVVAASRTINEQLFAIVNAYVHDLMAEYEEGLAVWRGDLSAERLQVLDSLLAGHEPTGAERILGLRLDGWHLVASIGRDQPGHVPDADGELGRVVAAVARALGASGSLVVPRDDSWVAWWTFRAAPRQVATRVADVGVPTWMRVGIGEPGRSVAGLGESHAGAELARLVARPATSAVTHYASSRTATLAVGDPRAAALFVMSVLRGALADDARTRDCRAAALAYLGTGMSRQKAANALQVAPNTVAYRVAAFSDLIGRAVDDRLVETLVALELLAATPSLLADQNPIGRPA